MAITFTPLTHSEMQCALDLAVKRSHFGGESMLLAKALLQCEDERIKLEDAGKRILPDINFAVE